MKILHLTLKKKWFDMILSGEKKEEYRDFTHYWESRLSHHNPRFSSRTFKSFDIIRFTNGYGKHRPAFDIELRSIRIGHGQSDWGAQQGILYNVLELGEITKTYNINGKQSNTSR